jgi:hypothetical protein
MSEGASSSTIFTTFYFLRNRLETVITLHPQANLAFTDPIMRRLEEKNSILRSHEDASILVESLLDLSWSYPQFSLTL